MNLFSRIEVVHLPIYFVQVRMKVAAKRLHINRWKPVTMVCSALPGTGLSGPYRKSKIPRENVSSNSWRKSTTQSFWLGVASVGRFCSTGGGCTRPDNVWDVQDVPSFRNPVLFVTCHTITGTAGPKQVFRGTAWSFSVVLATRIFTS